MALGLDDFDGGKSITRAIGRVGSWKSRLFWVPKWQQAKRAQFGPKTTVTFIVNMSSLYVFPFTSVGKVAVIIFLLFAYFEFECFTSFISAQFSYAIWRVHCLNREKFATGRRRCMYYLSAPARQNCAAYARTFFRRASTSTYWNLSKVFLLLSVKKQRGKIGGHFGCFS